MYGTIEPVRGFGAVKSSVAAQLNPIGDGGEKIGAHFLSGKEAAAQIESTTSQLRVPIITCNQQQLRWMRGADLPIE